MDRASHFRIINSVSIIAFSAAILHPVGRPNGIMDAIGQDVGILHAIWQETDLDFGTDELHGNIVRKVIDGNRSIKINLSYDAVHKAFIEPFLAFGRSDMGDTQLVAFHRRGVDGTVESSIAFANIISKQAIEFFQGRDFGGIEAVKPSILNRSETAFHLRLASSISNRCMDLDDTERTTNQSKLGIGIGTTIVQINFFT